jgi:predicted nicotinamide N-methyase
MSELLAGARMRYRLQRICEAAGALQIPLDRIASIDEAVDDLIALGDAGLEPAEVLRLTPYFGTLWPSARGLARWMAEHPAWLEGQTVLELGCGLALPALVAAKLGARVIAVDCHPDVPAFLRRNAELSSVHIEYMQVDWSAPAELAALQATLGRIDLVVGSDLLYEAAQAVSLPAALAELCPAGTRALLADPGRPHLQEAVNALEARGFTGHLEIRAVPGSVDDAVGGGASASTQEVFLLELVRRG